MMKVKLWGVRGSLPSPLAPQAVDLRMSQVLRGFFQAGHQDASQIDGYLKSLPIHRLGGYGGNTPCIEVSTPQSRLIIDGGSGIRSLGYDYMNGPCGRGQGEAHLLFTHFHWDHLIGLPFFTPIFIPGNKIHVYAVQPDLPEVFRTIFKKPYFPLNLEQLGATIVYHQLTPYQAVQFGDLSVTPYQLDHPDPCWGFKFEHKGKVFSHCVDTECTRTTPESLGADLPLYQNVDFMIFDAQYTLMESIEKVNWGHAAAMIGLDIAMREGVKKILFMHHDPASNDEKVAGVEAETHRYYQAQLKHFVRSQIPHHEVDWSFAREGQIIEL